MLNRRAVNETLSFTCRMERAAGTGTLAEVARSGRDEEATRIACRVVAALHRAEGGPPPELKPLDDMFHGLRRFGPERGGILGRSADLARDLLAGDRDRVILHGDVLDFGIRGWLAIDPKGFHGDRAFDYANLFCNPDAALALSPGRLSRTASNVVEEAGIERDRMLGWVQARAALFTAWLFETVQATDHAIEVAALAETERRAGSGVRAVAPLHPSTDRRLDGPRPRSPVQG